VFDIQGLVLRLPVILFSLTIHEFMHAWAAWKCGDDTARLEGRMTLNPLAHLDLMGTMMLMIAPIGWAKPVPVNPMNYRRPRRDDILVSGAGIAANFTMGILCALVLRFFGSQIAQLPQFGKIVNVMVLYACLINFGLGVFNLVPIFPLDGSHILQNLLPLNAAVRFAAMNRYGPIALMMFILGNLALSQTTGIDLLATPTLLLAGFFMGAL
jgi:Zn-dependent protease